MQDIEPFFQKLAAKLWLAAKVEKLVENDLNRLLTLRAVNGCALRQGHGSTPSFGSGN